MDITLKQQRLIYFIGLAVCAVLTVMGECNVMVDWQTSPDSQQAFAVQIVAIFATLNALPIAVRMKHTAKLWLVPLCCAIVLICYYVTLSTYTVLCLAIVAFALVYIYPKKRSIVEEKERIETEEEVHSEN